MEAGQNSKAAVLSVCHNSRRSEADMCRSQCQLTNKWFINATGHYSLTKLYNSPKKIRIKLNPFHRYASW